MQEIGATYNYINWDKGKEEDDKTLSAPIKDEKKRMKNKS